MSSFSHGCPRNLSAIPYWRGAPIRTDIIIIIKKNTIIWPPFRYTQNVPFGTNRSSTLCTIGGCNRPPWKKKVKHIKLGGTLFNYWTPYVTMAKQQKWLSQIAWIQQKAGLAKESYVYVCVRDPPRPPRGPRWHHPTLTVKGGIEGYQGPPLILFVRRMFRKGATHWVTGKLSEEGEKIYAALLDVMPKKGRTGYKETWKRRNFVREKIRNWLPSEYIYVFYIKI